MYITCITIIPMGSSRFMHAAMNLPSQCAFNVQAMYNNAVTQHCTADSDIWL